VTIDLVGGVKGNQEQQEQLNSNNHVIQGKPMESYLLDTCM
jgi:hypothetical protein